MARELEVGILLQPVNTQDWERYEDGAGHNKYKATDSEVWEGAKHIGLLVEPLGFDALWITEHHRTPYGMSPNPLQALAYFAGCTRRIALGSAVVVLPWHDPVRVAEDIALLDNLAGERRIRIGFGRGAAASEYQHLRIDQSSSRERFDEAVEVIKRALTQETFSYDGKIFQVPATSVRPRPRHPGIVNDFFCAFVGEPSLRAAAHSGLGMCFSVAKNFDAMRTDAELFNSIRAAQGMAPVPPMIVALLYCAATDDEAREGAIRYMGGYYSDARRHYHWEDVGSVRGYEHYKGRTTGKNQEFLNSSIWGSPATCLARIRELQAKTGLQHLIFTVWYGEMPVAEAEKSLRRFAEEVLPKL